MRSILSVLVNNSSGVLSHVAGLFARRGYNIDSLSVAETQDPSKSIITLVVNEEQNMLKQIKKQLYKLIDVIQIDDLSGENSFKRELVLLTVKATKNNRNQISGLVDAFQAKIVDMTKNAMMIELNGSQRTVSAFLKLLTDFGVLSVARTGTIALQYPSAEDT